MVASVGDAGCFVVGDLTRAATAEAIVKGAVGQHGRIDVVINNAARDHAEDLLDTSLEAARQLFDVNFFAALRLLQVSVPQMTSGGAIVNVTSRLATVGVPSMALYGASKGALLSLTRGAAIELAPRGIRVNAVAPGMTRTPLFDAWRSEQHDPEGAEREIIERPPRVA